MSFNPYLAPHAQSNAQAPASRTPLILGVLGAGLASLYWAGLTLLIGFGVATGSVSPLQVLLPCVLIGLYAVRAVQLLKGDPAAAKRLVWLHGVGGVMAIFQLTEGGAVLIALQGIKVAIHIFGGLTAYYAQRALERRNG